MNAWIAGYEKPDFYQWAIVLKEINEPIGSISVVDKDVPEAEYVVFEHGPFDYEHQNCSVEEKIEKIMNSFNYSEYGYQLDTSCGRVMYFFTIQNVIGNI